MTTKKILLCVIALILAISANAQGAKLRITLPPGISRVELLSGGTAAVLDYLRERMDQQIQELNQHYQIQLRETELASAKKHLENTATAYRNEINAIRAEYLSKIILSVDSASAEISPESSALGEIDFYYTVRNNSDRIISSVIYTPKIGNDKMPTSSSLILELINPATLKYGVEAGKTISNKGFLAENFSFFIKELKKGQISLIKSKLQKEFSIAIVDLRFVNEIAYKGQFKEMDVIEAFQHRLGSLRQASEKAKELAAIKKDNYEKALREYTGARDLVINEFLSAAAQLEKTSIRHTSTVNSNNKTTIENIDAGSYIVYAQKENGLAVYEVIEINTSKHEFVINELIKDPFIP